MANAQAIGIDIGGTNLRVGVFEGHVCLEEIRFPAHFSSICQSNTPQAAWQEILSITSASIQTVLKKFPNVKAVGIGFPGFIHPVTGVIAKSPNLPGLKNVNLAKDLSAVLNRMVGVNLKVVVANDANVAAFGEYVLADKPSGGLLYCGLGTGVGGGLVLSGMPYAGQHGCAMEVGHIIVVEDGRACGCGNKGCMEQYASASGVVISYLQEAELKLTAAEIAERAQTGDAAAIAAYQLAGKSLAQALASIIKVVDVGHVVIGGGMSGAWSLMSEAFNARLQHDLIPVLRDKINVTSSSAGDIAGMLGAAYLALA